MSLIYKFIAYLIIITLFYNYRLNTAGQLEFQNLNLMLRNSSGEYYDQQWTALGIMMKIIQFAQWLNSLRDPSTLQTLKKNSVCVIYSKSAECYGDGLYRFVDSMLRSGPNDEDAGINDEESTRRYRMLRENYYDDTKTTLPSKGPVSILFF